MNEYEFTIRVVAEGNSFDDAVNRVMAASEEVPAELYGPCDEVSEEDRLRKVLQQIRDQDWVDNVLDPQGAARIAASALSKGRR